MLHDTLYRQGWLAHFNGQPPNPPTERTFYEEVLKELRCSRASLTDKLLEQCVNSWLEGWRDRSNYIASLYGDE